MWTVDLNVELKLRFYISPACVAWTLPQVEQVQRRASRWIPRTRRDEMSYKERLTMLDLLPLSLDRELEDLVFFYNCLYISTDLDVLNYLSFVSHLPFLGLPYLFMLFIYVEHPIKLKKKNTGKTQY